MLKALLSISLFAPLTVLAEQGMPLDNQAASNQGGGFEMLLLLGLMVVMMYFLIWRPQSKKTKEHKELMSQLSKGDEVSTIGGIVGKVAKVTDDYIAVEISAGVELKFQKSAVSATLPKGTLKSI